MLEWGRMESSSTSSSLASGTCFGYPMKLVIAKVLFFCTSMSGVGWNRFQSIYFLQRGLNPGEIGLLKSLGLVLKVAGEPFWCIIADMTDEKAMFVVTLLMNVITMEILRIWQPLTFNVIFAVKILRTVTAPGGTLTTTASFRLTEGSNEGYGQQRMFGSLAWGFGALAVGFLIDTVGIESIFFFNYTFFLISFLAVVLYLPKPSPSSSSSTVTTMNKQNTSSVEIDDREAGSASVTLLEQNHNISTYSNGHGSSSSSSRHKSIISLLYGSLSEFLKKYGQFFKAKSIRVLCLNVFLYGSIMCIPDTFFYVSLEKDYHSSRTFNGLCTTVSTLACLPIFWYSESLIIRYGHHKMITMSQILCAVRLVLYTLASPNMSINLWQSYFIFVQLIHGFNFALFWAAAVDAFVKLAPKDLTNSCVATLNMIYFTCGGIVGNALVGYAFDYGGSSMVYLAGAACMGGTLLLFNSEQAAFDRDLAKEPTD